MIPKIVWLRRKSDGMVLDIPERDVAETLKRGFELVPQNEVYENSQVKFPEVPTTLECPLCGKACKNEAGLKIHKATHK